jgi:hypothetical protein
LVYRDDSNQWHLQYGGELGNAKNFHEFEGVMRQKLSGIIPKELMEEGKGWTPDSKPYNLRKGESIYIPDLSRVWRYLVAIILSYSTLGGARVGLGC